MKRLTRSEIKAELEKPNGSAEIMNDSTIDKISLCDETTAMFIEENIGSALMIRLAKSRAMLPQGLCVRRILRSPAAGGCPSSYSTSSRCGARN